MESKQSAYIETIEQQYYWIIHNSTMIKENWNNGLMEYRAKSNAIRAMGQWKLLSWALVK